jgi:hypothetical protein
VTTPTPVDVDTLAGMAGPLRVELGAKKTEIVARLHEARIADTYTERLIARQSLATARRQRDAYRRLLVAIQTVLDLEATHA